jgi:NTE family protein
MKALVLGGGSMKGAYQVGAIKAVLESGFEPDMIYGISVGALNTTFLVNEAGKQLEEKGKVDWKKVARLLMEFWIKEITSPQVVGTLKSRVSLGVHTLMSQYEGLLDPSPLHDLIKRVVSLEQLRASPAKCKVGAVNINTGEMHYASPEDDNYFDYLFASSSIPMIMPPVPIGDQGDLFMDGALREVIPIRKAFEDGATEVVIVACHARSVYQREHFNARNLISLIQRVKDITVNQEVNNDILWANIYVERAVLRGENVSVKVIRPSTPPSLDLTKFSSEDISRLIVEGYRQGLEIIGGAVGAR